MFRIPFFADHCFSTFLFGDGVTVGHFLEFATAFLDGRAAPPPLDCARSVAVFFTWIFFRSQVLRLLPTTPRTALFCGSVLAPALPIQETNRSRHKPPFSISVLLFRARTLLILFRAGRVHNSNLCHPSSAALKLPFFPNSPTFTLSFPVLVLRTWVSFLEVSDHPFLSHDVDSFFPLFFFFEQSDKFVPASHIFCCKRIWTTR